MSNHSFMFLDEDFKDISKFCMRMEKNIVEGDGVDAVIWAGKVGERITHYISKFVNLDLGEYDQNKKLVILLNKDLIPEEIYDQLDSIRQYRNIATHHDLNSELQIALKVHRRVFNILCWFYGVYKADESILNLKYPGITYKHDESFINRLKNNTSLNINESKGSSLSQLDVDYDVHKLFNQNNVYFNEDLGKYTAYIMDNDKKITIGHFKTKEVAVRKGLNFVLSDDFKIYKNFPIKPEKLEDGRYSDRKGIDYDEEEGLWTARFNKTDLGYFISQNSAIIARKEYIDTLPLPEEKNGSYSDYKEITFDLNHKLWCIKKDGKIFDYYDSEEEAIYNLTRVLNINIPLEKLGIIKDEESSRWRIYYRNKYVATCDSEKEAIDRRLEYVSSFAQPKRNKGGEFSIHKGIFYDEKNLIWILRIKGELLGFFDSEEEAFNFKKEFLKSKGFDVTDFIFNEEESFDENFDFKVRINSDENAIQYNEESEEWIVYFRGNEIDRCKSELDAKRSRIAYLKSIPYPPRKEDNRYSAFEGIDYDINHHLWTAEYNKQSLGFFDSEEDAFYALKEHLVKEGIDVSEMHFKECSDEDIDIGDDGDLVENEISGSFSNGDSLEADTIKSDGLIEEKNKNKNFASYYDIFLDKDDSIDDLNDKKNVFLDKDDSIDDLNDKKNVFSEKDDSKVGLNGKESVFLDKDDSIDDLNDKGNVKGDGLLIETDKSSLKNINDYKKNSFYGMANKMDKDFESSNEISIYDLESDDEENDFIDDIEMEKGNSEISDRFSKQHNVHMGLNRKAFDGSKSNKHLIHGRDFKEIRFNSYDLDNFRREIILSYNDEKLFISFEGMINKLELKKILSNDYFNNTDELNYKREDKDLFSIFINLQYSLEAIDLNELLDVFSNFSWNFDLLNHLSKKDGFNIESVEKEKNQEKFSILSSSRKANALKEDDNSLSGEIISKPKDYMNGDNVSRRKVYTKQKNNISSKNEKSNLKSEKAIIRGGVRVTLEEAQELDNAKEEPEIKSTIIDKKPEARKEFRTTSLGNFLEINRRKNEGEDEITDDLESNPVLDGVGSGFISDDLESKSVLDGVGSGFISDDLESGSVEEDILVDSVVVESGSVEEDILVDSVADESGSLGDEDFIYDSIVESSDSSYGANLDEDDFKDDFDYGDIADEDGFSSDLSFDDIFGNDEETSFEEELDNYDFNESDDLGSDDLNSTDSNISDSNSESDDFILDSNEESSLEETVSKPKEIKKVKKPKKAKKEKKIPEDAFDEKYKNSHEIEYDEDNNRWLAYMGGELIRSFDTPKEAVIERKKLLRRNVSIPRKGFNGKYSDEEGIDFDLRERIWTVSFNGIITNFATNEKDAIIKKKLFSLILDQLEINQDDFNEEIFDELKEMDLDSLLDSLNDDEFEEIGLSPKESKRKLN